MKVFFILAIIYANFLWLTDGQCNSFLKIGCKKTATTTSSTTPTPVKDSEDQVLKSSADVESKSDDETKGTAITSSEPSPSSSESKETKETSEQSSPKTESSEESTTSEGTVTEATTSLPISEAPKKKGLFSSLTSTFTRDKNKGPGVNDQNQEVFLQRYYKALQERMVRKGKDEDKELKQEYKSGAKDQVEKEKTETDGFFTQFKNYLGKTCFANIGCFYATEYNDFSNRPIPMLPMSPDAISPKFHMYTLEARSIPRNFSYNASSNQLRYSTFNPKLRTAFIVHGFQSGYALWMENLKDYIFYRSDDNFNVVVVVWEKGSKVAMYNLAATNTRVVGACIAFFIETLCKTFDIKYDTFYLIGHSLGGHTIGYAGKRLLNPKVARITALDPAGVGFHFTNPQMRLDSSDATVVMAIHTDGALIFSEGFGTQDTLGHFDFYPNGGTWQPGCPESNSVAQKLGSITSGKDITCSHSRACLIINNLDKPEDSCDAVAYQCPSYELFIEGRCADCTENRCELMGLNPDYWLTNNKPNNQTINKKYYINTSHKEDYCLQHYQFGLHITNDSDSVTGNLHFNLQMKVEDEMKEVTISRIMSKTTQKKIHTFLVNFDFKIDKIFAVQLIWSRYNPQTEKIRVNRGFKLRIPYIEINYMSHIDPEQRLKYSSILCATNPNVIANKGLTPYKECSPDLKQKALTTEPEKLVALEWRQDIYAVDYQRIHKVFHKIAGTRIKETIEKNAKVN